MKLWQIGLGVAGGLLLLSGKARAKTNTSEEPRPQYGSNPRGYPEPPIPTDVGSDWLMPDWGWIKSDAPPQGQSQFGGQLVRDSKGYWWVLVRPGV